MTNSNQALIVLRKITRAIDLRSKRLLRETGLTSPQLLILQLLDEHGDISSSQIAKEVSLSQATITSIIDRMTKAQLVSRRPSDKDKRVTFIHIEQLGIEKLEKAPELLQDSFSSGFDKLKEWEMLQILSSLERVAELMNAEFIEASPFLEVGDINATPPTPQQ